MDYRVTHIAKVVKSSSGKPGSAAATDAMKGIDYPHGIPAFPGSGHQPYYSGGIDRQLDAFLRGRNPRFRG